MEVRAVAKSVRISPRKLRLVAEAVKRMPIDDAYRVLEMTHKRAALVVQKTLKSAVANAVKNANLDSKNLDNRKYYGERITAIQKIPSINKRESTSLQKTGKSFDNYFERKSSCCCTCTESNSEERRKKRGKNPSAKAQDKKEGKK